MRLQISQSSPLFSQDQLEPGVRLGKASILDHLRLPLWTLFSWSTQSDQHWLLPSAHYVGYLHLTQVVSGHPIFMDPAVTWLLHLSKAECTGVTPMAVLPQHILHVDSSELPCSAENKPSSSQGQPALNTPHPLAVATWSIPIGHFGVSCGRAAASSFVSKLSTA